MQTEIAETIYKKVKTLPPEKQEKILEFVESIEETKEPQKKSLFEKLADIRERVPEEVWEKLPTDGAENHDYYLYGAAKKKR